MTLLLHRLAIWVVVKPVTHATPSIDDSFELSVPNIVAETEMRKLNQMGPAIMSLIPSPSMMRRLESYKNDSHHRTNQMKYKAQVRDSAVNTDAVSITEIIIQPGYCVREDCMNCMRLQMLIGIAGICKASCPA